jgi:hypothetical protein
VRHLHLAFKGLSTDEMYDVLMEQLLMAVKRYDPAYTEKVKITAEKIDEVIAHAKSFTVSELNDYLEFDCNKFVRLLCRRGFLAPVRANGQQKISGWKRTGHMAAAGWVLRGRGYRICILSTDLVPVLLPRGSIH